MPQPDAYAEAPPPRQSMMPRGLVILLGLAAAFVAAEGAREIQSTLASAFMALNLVIVVWPIQKAIAKVFPKFVASLVAGICAIGILIGVVWSMGWAVTRLVQELPQYAAPFNRMIDSVMDFAGRHGFNTGDQSLWENISNYIQANISSVMSTLTSFASALGSVVSALTSIIGLIVIVVMILVFMIIDSVDFSERMLRLGERHNSELVWALNSFAKGTRKYWIVATIFGLIVAVCDGVLLMAFGVPLAIVWAILSFVTNYIPNIGFIIGLIPPALMAFLAVDPWTALWVVIGYCVLNVLIQTVIQPRFTGDAAGITPTVAVLSLLIWAWVLGPLGALLAIPATLLLKSLMIDIDPQARWVNAFIASDATTSDQDPIRLSNLLARAKRIRKMTAQGKVEELGQPDKDKPPVEEAQEGTAPAEVPSGQPDPSAEAPQESTASPEPPTQ